MKSLNKMASIAKGLMLAAFLAVGTTVVNAEETTTYEPTAAGKWVKGEEITGNGQQVYIYNVGAGIFITDRTAKVTDIQSASLWNVDGDNTYKFVNGNSKLYMEYDAVGWFTDITTIASATSFTLIDKSTLDNSTSYRLMKSAKVWLKTQTRYFNVDGSKYTAAESKGDYNLWLFISTTQKEAYTTYASLFNKLSGYLDNEKVAADKNMPASIQSTLTARSGDNCTYTTYEDDKAALEAKIEEVEAFINSTTTGIKFNAVNGKAEVTAIYNTNGVRQNNLTKGINIVKMSDGTTKKIIK